MSLPLALNDILSVQFYSQVAEQTAIMGFHYRVTTIGASAATDADAADALSTTMATPIKALLENNALYQGVQVRVLTHTPPPSPVLSAIGSAAGSAGAVGLPRQTAGLLSFQTGFAGPGRRGRMYVAFPAAADNVAGGSASAGYITRMQALAADLEGPINVAAGGRTATLTAVVFSRKLNTPFTIISSTTSNKWATQRRRGSFGRANTGPFG